ncbi:MAG: glycosyltransferase family 4 protein [Desulfobacteraceae bacterium]|nr:glycosyltransferase family 4 protein [Desulfobacteraceae bacterium]
MHFVFLSSTMKFTGGTKLLFDYASYLRQAGHKVDVLVKSKVGTLKDSIYVTVVKNFNSETIPECDLVIATTPRDLQQALDSKKNKVVNFCQGLQVIGLEERIKGYGIPFRFQKKGVLNKLRLMRKKISWQRKINRIDKLYRLPMPVITVAKPLQRIFERRYGQKVDLCVNGVHEKYFFPLSERREIKINPDSPLRILSVGPLDVSVKGIAITLDAIKKLKDNGIPIHFTRVAPEFIDIEKDNPCVDKFFENVSPEKMGEIMRSSDIYISNSFAAEGFGLPAIEALSCGLLCVLSSIPSYKSFSIRDDFCFFLDENNDDGTVKAIHQIIQLQKSQIENVRNNALEVASDFSLAKACKRFEQILIKLSKI